MFHINLQKANPSLITTFPSSKQRNCELPGRNPPERNQYNFHSPSSLENFSYSERLLENLCKANRGGIFHFLLSHTHNLFRGYKGLEDELQAQVEATPSNFHVELLEFPDWETVPVDKYVFLFPMKR